MTDEAPHIDPFSPDAQSKMNELYREQGKQAHQEEVARQIRFRNKKYQEDLEALHEQEAIETLEALDNLPSGQLYQLERLSEAAFRDTDIEGYGDEGAGYDAKEFVRNLIEAGWVFRGKGD